MMLDGMIRLVGAMARQAIIHGHPERTPKLSEPDDLQDEAREFVALVLRDKRRKLAWCARLWEMPYARLRYELGDAQDAARPKTNHRGVR